MSLLSAGATNERLEGSSSKGQESGAARHDELEAHGQFSSLRALIENNDIYL